MKRDKDAWRCLEKLTDMVTALTERVDQLENDHMDDVNTLSFKGIELEQRVDALTERVERLERQNLPWEDVKSEVLEVSGDGCECNIPTVVTISHPHTQCIECGGIVVKGEVLEVSGTPVRYGGPTPVSPARKAESEENSLVLRVAVAIEEHEALDIDSFRPEARAAIREVADYLQNGLFPTAAKWLYDHMGND